MRRFAIALILFAAVAAPAQQHSWSNKDLSPDTRADLVLKEMTLDEKIQLVHGTGWGVLQPNTPIPANSNLGGGFVPGIPRLGIPDLNLQDSAVGVRMSALQSRYATLLPSTLGLAASWDTDAATLYGQVIGRELRAQGFNMSIGGGVNLMRDPRNGRNFEYAGDDPLLAGTIVGTIEKGVATQHIMNDIKHYALNDQETGREIYNAMLDHRAARESDLLAFQIALEIAQPSGVMCSYNKVNGDYSCENDYLLNEVLKKDFNFKGFVLSDWTGTHSTVRSALAGLDMEQPGDFDVKKAYFGQPLEDAVLSNQVSRARLDDMVHRILRSMFAAGVIDNPPVKTVVDPFRGRDDAQHIAEESIVLLRDRNNVLPLAPTIKSIAIIGGHADIGVLSGGGSAQVDAPGGNALDGSQGTAVWAHAVYFPSVPLKEIAAHAPNAHVAFNDGANPAAAAAFARTADVAIVFVTQFMREEVDAKSLALPDDQDALVAAVAAANPHTIVIIESGGPITMPWVDKVGGILEAWYPGIGGAQAIANILFGAVNPSAKLAATFPRTEADLPRPVLPGSTRTFPPGTSAGKQNQTKPFDVDYNIEGARVGYKWFDSENKAVLFPFGFGLSYTTFAYSYLIENQPENGRAEPYRSMAQSRDYVMLTIKNTGKRTGTEIAQLYLEPTAAGENYKRLAGWKRVTLAPGESQIVTIQLDPRTLSLDGGAMDPAGEYHLYVGSSSRDLPLHATVQR